MMKNGTDNETLAQKMKKSMPNAKVFEVVLQRIYIVEGSHPTIETIDEEWFANGRISGSHAHRDACHVYGSDEILVINEVTETEGGE